MRYVLNGQDITNQPFTLNGIRYPANWWNNTTPDKIAALGIEAVPEPEPEPIEPEPQYKSAFTPLEFLDRFTEQEQLAVVAATMQSAEVKLWYDKLLAASYVDLDDPRTAEGIDALIAAELIAPERRDEVLAPEVIE